jgi:hypothetical protein
MMTGCCLQVHAELGDNWNETISSQEIALYGALCGLAHFDRKELGSHIITNSSFREYLEVYPQVGSWNLSLFSQIFIELLSLHTENAR